jgi:hypothetical protein
MNREYATKKEYGKLLEKMAGNEARGTAGVRGLGDVDLPLFELASGHPLVAGMSIAKKAVSAYLDNPAMRARLLDSLSGSERIVKIARQTQGAWDHSVSRLVSSSGASSAPSVASLPLSSYAELVAQVQKASENPTYAQAAVHDHIGANVQSAHPAIADHASGVAGAAINYLAQNMPKTQPAGLLDPVREPSSTEKQAWLNAYQAVVNPQSVVHNPTEEGLKALQTVYPASHNAAVGQILSRLQDTKLSYQQKLKAAKLLGPSAVSDVSPDVIAFSQSILAPPPAPQGQKGSARTAGASRAKARKMNFEATASDNETPLQHAMGRE